MAMTFGQIQEVKRNRIPKPWIVRKQYEEFLSGYATTASKKTAMGKEIVAEIDFITSLQDQFKRKDKPKTAWHDGIPYTQHDLHNAVDNLSVMLQLKSEIGKELAVA